MATFTAEYPGVCAACDERYKRGTEVMYDADGDLVHFDCPSLLPTDNLPVCPRCFLAYPPAVGCSCGE